MYINLIFLFYREWVHTLYMYMYINFIFLFYRELCKKYTKLYTEKLSSSSPGAPLVAKLLVNNSIYIVYV